MPCFISNFQKFNPLKKSIKAFGILRIPTALAYENVVGGVGGVGSGILIKKQAPINLLPT